MPITNIRVITRYLEENSHALDNLEYKSPLLADYIPAKMVAYQPFEFWFKYDNTRQHEQLFKWHARDYRPSAAERETLRQSTMMEF